MIPPIVLPAMAAVALLEAEVSGIVISITVVECVVAAVVLEVLGKTLEGHESALSSSKLTLVHFNTISINIGHHHHLT